MHKPLYRVVRNSENEVSYDDWQREDNAHVSIFTGLTRDANYGAHGAITMMTRIKLQEHFESVVCNFTRFRVQLY
jgi:hypothetical protein